MPAAMNVSLRCHSTLQHHNHKAAVLCTATAAAATATNAAATIAQLPACKMLLLQPQLLSWQSMGSYCRRRCRHGKLLLTLLLLS